MTLAFTLARRCLFLCILLECFHDLRPFLQSPMGPHFDSFLRCTLREPLAGITCTGVCAYHLQHVLCVRHTECGPDKFALAVSSSDRWGDYWVEG